MAAAQGPTTKLEDVRNPFADLLPNCFDVEKALLGTLLIRNDLYTDVAAIVNSDSFAEEVHKSLFAAIGMMIRKDKPATPISLKPYVGEADLGEGVTPMAYLSSLARDAGVPANALGYAKEVRDFAARRSYIQSCAKGMMDAWQPNADITVNDLLRMHEDRVEKVRPKLSGKRQGFRSMREIAEDTFKAIQDEWNGTVSRYSLTTGFKKLDAKIGGLEAPDLVIIAGRPASGKTALLVDLVINASIQLREEKLKDPKARPGIAAVISLEMGDKQLGERMFSRVAQVSGTRIRRRALDAPQIAKLYEASVEVGQLPIYVDDAGGLSISQITARARTMHRKHRLRLLAVDYLQLIKSPGNGRNESRRHEEIAEITAALKELAKELQIPVVLLSQVGRQVDARENKRPNDSDLKDSGSIEQDADTIMFVYREESYVIKEQPLPGTEEHMEWEKRFEKVKGIAEVIIGKNRFGGPGTVVMGFDGPHTTFLEDPPQKEIEPEVVRERISKAPALPAKSGLLYEITKGLLLHHGRQATEEERERQLLKGRPLPKNARLIDRNRVFKSWHDDRMPEATEAEAQRAFMSAMDVLRARSMTSSIGSKEDGVFIWLPELVG